MQPAEFRVDLAHAPGAVTLTVAGELDACTSPRLEEHLAGLMQSHRGTVVIDLRETTFIDSSGLAVLLAAHKHATRDSWNLTIVRGPRAVQMPIEISGLADVLPLADAPPALG